MRARRAPFELLFGRKHCIRSELVIEQKGPVAQFNERRELFARISHAEAIARQSDQQQRNKKYHEERSVYREFELGTKVLVKTIGQRSKLQNRFAGPYRVVARKNDIYELQSCDSRSEKLERHVADLKSFNEAEITSAVANTSPSDNRPIAEGENGWQPKIRTIGDYDRN